MEEPSIIEELSMEFCLEIIGKNHKKYFKIQELAEEVIMYYNPNVSFRDFSHDDKFRRLKKQLIHYLIPILCNLQEMGIIEKYSNKFWKLKGSE